MTCFSNLLEKLDQAKSPYEALPHGLARGLFGKYNKEPEVQANHVWSY